MRNEFLFPLTSLLNSYAHIKLGLKHPCDSFQNNVNFLKVDLRDKSFYKETPIIVGCNIHTNSTETFGNKNFMTCKKEKHASFLLGDFDMFQISCF